MKWVILIVVVLAGYVRLAPSDPARWHRAVVGDADRISEGSVLRLAAVDLAALDQVARDWPRTSVLAGSVAEGRVTYLTRSAFWGFPDYTTVETRPNGVAIYARLRFGRRDFGVNGKRVASWLDALQ